MSRVKNNVALFLLIALCSAQFVESSAWDMIEDEDILLDWLSYAKQAYYMYELEANTFLCIIKGIWRVARNWVLEQPDAIIPQISTSTKAGLNGGSIEKYDVTTIKTPAEPTYTSLEMNRRQEGSRLAWLLGITAAQFARDYDDTHTVVPAKKKSAGWNKSEGELEMIIMKIMVESHPMIGALIKLFGGIVYLVHHAAAVVKSSVVLSCAADYAYQRGAEWIYLDI